MKPLFVAVGMAVVLSVDAGAQSSPPRNSALTTVAPAYLISTAQATAWHRFKAAGGPTFSGSTSWKRFLGFLESNLAKQGVVDLTKNRWTYDRWRTGEWPGRGSWSLMSAGKRVPVASYGAYSGSTGPRGVSAELVYYDPNAPPSSMRGKIVVYEAPPHPEPPYDERYRTWFTINDSEFASDSAGFHPRFARVPPDETITLDTWWQLRGVSVNFYDLLAKAGALAGVAVFNMSYERLAGLYTFPVQTQHQTPVLYLDRAAGLRVIDDAKQGKRAVLELRATVEPTETYQLIGYLPGRAYGTAGDERVLLTTHTDGPSISQDDGALGLLGIVTYFAHIPRRDRPKTLMVFLDNRHYMPGMEPAFAEQDWFARHPEERKKIGGIIAMEHLGEMEFREQGETVTTTGRPEITFLWTRASPNQVEEAIEAVKANRLPRTLVQAVERPGIHGGTQGTWYGMGTITLQWDLPGFSMLGYLGGYWTTRS
ncbi:MAG: hypothetical protein ABI647_22620, partial [Gemmatimonadota bacterium]